MANKKIKIVYTGGTVGGIQEYDKPVSEDLKPDRFMVEFYKNFPQYKQGLQITYTTPVKKFSEEMIPTDWVVIAKDIYGAINSEKVDGIVIAHGTDTMAYTASALSFMLRGLKIPVIITGSNYPITKPNTDAFRNMNDALIVAINSSFKGVFVVFSGINDQLSQIHLGSKVRKVQFHENNFHTINRPSAIGKLDKKFLSGNDSIKVLDVELYNKIVNNNMNVEFELLDKLDSNISFFKIYPGFKTEKILHDVLGVELLLDKNGQYRVTKKTSTKAIILELYNSGTGPTLSQKQSLIDTIVYAKNKNIPVFITSQQIGKVEMDLYESSIKIQDAGAVPLGNIISETAITKLMWVLGQTQEYNEIIEMMLTDYSGELL